MKFKFTNVLMFAVGAAVGSAVTWKFVKTKYERIAQEEIESVTEAFSSDLSNHREKLDVLQHGIDEIRGDADEHANTTRIDWNRFEDLEEEDEENDGEVSDEDRTEYHSIAEKYTSEKGGADDMAKEPYVISPYDFGELDDYKQFELTYYADGTLEDEDYNIITDPEVLLGPKALHTFGEYEDDSVFVRNEKLKADFQILKDYRTYSEARSIGPGQGR